MNKEEKRILHGLYFHREMVGESMQYAGEEVRWLADHWLCCGKRWQCKDGTMRRAGAQGDPRVTEFKPVTADTMRPLRYLISSGYVARERTPSSSMLSLSVTPKGANRARQLGSTLGRINLLYREQKDGLLGLVITILVAAITAYFTTKISGK